MSGFKAKMHQIRFRLGLIAFLQTTQMNLRGPTFKERWERAR